VAEIGLIHSPGAPPDDNQELITVNTNLDFSGELEAAYLLFALHTVNTELFPAFLDILERWD